MIKTKKDSFLTMVCNDLRDTIRTSMLLHVHNRVFATGSSVNQPAEQIVPHIIFVERRFFQGPMVLATLIAPNRAMLNHVLESLHHD